MMRALIKEVVNISQKIAKESLTTLLLIIKRITADEVS